VFCLKSKECNIGCVCIECILRCVNKNWMMEWELDLHLKKIRLCNQEIQLKTTKECNNHRVAALIASKHETYKEHIYKCVGKECS
jgi:hypothetical protein